MQLRPYQTDCIRSLWNWLKKNPSDNPLLVLPTGSGKSLIISKICELITSKKPHLKILILAHRKELLEQNTDELLTLCDESLLGIYCAGLGKKEIANITVASIQSIYNKTYLLPSIDVMIVDECHLLSEYGDSMYQQLISKLLDKNPIIRIIGLTATPFRLEGGNIYGADKTFADIAYSADLKQLIDDGYLCKLRNKVLLDETIDTSKLGKVAGDYNKGELYSLFENSEELMDKVADKILAIKQQENRKSLLVFCSGKAHTVKMATRFIERGLNGWAITGETDSNIRDESIEKFKSGEYEFLTNCNILTTGFNAPNIDMLVMLRPTLSTSLYVQMLGRGMRNAEEKPDCLVLDFAGNIQQHGSLLNLKIYSTEAKEPEKYRLCPECEELTPYSNPICFQCGYEFAIEKREFKPNHNVNFFDEMDIMDGVGKPAWFDIQSFWLTPHQKIGKPDSIKVNIKTTCHKWISEWICVEHNGYAKQKAEDWLMEFFNVSTWTKPEDWTVKGVIAKHSQMKKPIAVKAQLKDNWWQVKEYKFAN